jgi:hypothetical protein
MVQISYDMARHSLGAPFVLPLCLQAQSSGRSGWSNQLQHRRHRQRSLSASAAHPRDDVVLLATSIISSSIVRPSFE